jgi:hypothetical protein
VSQISSAQGVKRTARRPWLALALGLSWLLPVVHGQTPSTFGTMVDGKLTVSLLDGSPQIMDRSDISKLPHMTVKVRGSGGKISIYSGVPLEELLKHVGAVFGKERRQINLGSIVLVESVDQPSILFAMAEFDIALTDKRILLADTKDGRPLTAPEGPFASSFRMRSSPLVGRSRSGRSTWYRFQSHSNVRNAPKHVVL